jgi:hypothetical protein
MYWYEKGTGFCSYSDKAKNHSELAYFPEVKDAHARGIDINDKFIRGRVVIDSGMYYVLVYRWCMSSNISYGLLADIRYKVGDKAGIKIDRVVDEMGYLLQEMKNGR